MKKMLCIIILIALTNTINAQIDENPVDSEANEATRELYHYLRNEVWGKKVISGSRPNGTTTSTMQNVFTKREANIPK